MVEPQIFFWVLGLAVGFSIGWLLRKGLEADLERGRTA